MTNPKQEKNVFFDISKLPKGWGMIVFPISMSRILKDQSADKVFDHLRMFQPDKINENKVGITLLYSDGLYEWKKDEEYISRKNSLAFINNHRNAYLNQISKNSFEFQIKDAFDFISWNQISISTNDFMDKYNKCLSLAKEDEKFLDLIKEDCKDFNRDFDENQMNFFLEEIIVFYLITKMKVVFNNVYTENREEWALLAYPGKPLKSMVYFFQKNILGLNNTGNKYENSWYDLSEKKLIEFDRVDLETYKVK
ncbi:MAG: hypothetical protein QG580_413 [Patescibacteria group bacterium]|jgi:hypothetical protein|nr:hypothetical protein [Patescibacteria group bacterium]